jgi:D-sedoheptulose 7-phosphate isomerase
VERLREAVSATEAETIGQVVAALQSRLNAGGTLLIFGNGGSATDANDWALDCVSSPKGRPPIRALSLAASGANLSALANDLGADAMFQRQIIACAAPEDVAIAISTSGGSANIIAALAEARRRALLTVALVGGNGGEIRRRRLADHVIVVPSDYVPRAQEVHASVYHTILDLLAGVPQ